MCAGDPPKREPTALPRQLPDHQLWGGGSGCCVPLSLLVVVAWIATVSAQRPVETDPPPGGLLIESYEWHDADTPVDCKVCLPYGVTLDEPRGLRASTYDAWEIGSRGGAEVTDAERVKGRKALDEIRRLSVGRSLYVIPEGRGKRDSFGRPLGRLVLWRPGDTIDVGEWAKAHGHVRPAKE